MGTIDFFNGTTVCVVNGKGEVMPIYNGSDGVDRHDFVFAVVPYEHDTAFGLRVDNTNSNVRVQLKIGMMAAGTGTFYAEPGTRYATLTTMQDNGREFTFHRKYSKTGQEIIDDICKEYELPFPLVSDLVGKVELSLSVPTKKVRANLSVNPFFRKKGVNYLSRTYLEEPSERVLLKVVLPRESTALVLEVFTWKTTVADLKKSIEVQTGIPARNLDLMHATIDNSLPDDTVIGGMITQITALPKLVITNVQDGKLLAIPGGSATITVMRLSGREIILDINENETTVGDLKAMIANKKGIPPDQQNLIFNNKQLEDRCILGTGLDGCTVHLVLRLRGGGGGVVSCSGKRTSQVFPPFNDVFVAGATVKVVLMFCEKQPKEKPVTPQLMMKAREH